MTIFLAQVDKPGSSIVVIEASSHSEALDKLEKTYGKDIVTELPYIPDDDELSLVLEEENS